MNQNNTCVHVYTGKSALVKICPQIIYTVVGNFRGCKISPEGSRRNFCGFNFRGAHMHGEARRYQEPIRAPGAIDIVLAAIIAVFIFAEADLSGKPRNFAPCENFPLYSTSARKTS